MKIIVITPPERAENETVLCNLLFDHGLEILHLRKPGASVEAYESYIQEIEPEYRTRIVLHDHYELAGKYKVRGIHLKSGRVKDYLANPILYKHVSFSCHTPEEVREIKKALERISPKGENNLQNQIEETYCFLSPLFNSVSKNHYSSSFKSIPLITKEQEGAVIGLGGITPERIGICREAGYEGVAVLGYIWEKPEEAVKRYIQLKTPYVLSIAGLDPSSGAGISADLKTLENTGSYGLGVLSALTFQNDREYQNTRWIPMEDIIPQCEVLFKRWYPEYVKIGLIENLQVLDQLTDYLTKTLPGVKIVWDPILKATAGKQFHCMDKNENRQYLHDILKRLYAITPNREEMQQLFPEYRCDEKTGCFLAKSFDTKIICKSVYQKDSLITDVLYEPEHASYFTIHISEGNKHGTGCICSSAFTSLCAQGVDVKTAWNKAQTYVSNVINSNDSRLGYHTIGDAPDSKKPALSTLKVQYITDPKEGSTLCEQVEAVCKGGIRWIQLRMKGTDEKELIREGRLIKQICRKYNALFIVDDHYQVARLLDADGVHLGKEDENPQIVRNVLGPDKIIGLTCNTWEDILYAETQHADYIGLGPYAFTTTKKKLSPVLGLEGYRHLLTRMKQAHIHIPVFAIGGIREKDIVPLIDTGIQGIALSGLIKNSNNLEFKSQEIISILNSINI